MAEVFGVVASAIALLHLTAKGARILQSIPEIESDFEELCEEIQDIEDSIEHARLTTPSSAAGIIKNKIARTAQRLFKINEDLKQIESKLKKEMEDGTFKVKRARWLIKANTIGKLLQKARNAKDDLSHAVDWQKLAMMDHMMQTSTRTEQTTITIRDYLVLFANSVPPSDVRPNEPRRVEELHDSSSDTDEEEGRGEGQYQEAPPGDDPNQDDQTITHRSSLRAGVVTTRTSILTERMMPSCPEDCFCGCHARSRRRRNAGWAGNLLGYLGVQYDLPPRDGGQDSRCACDGQRWHLEYRPPSWLEARVWLLSGSFGTAGPTYSLRAARVVPWSNMIWIRVKQSAQAIRYSITNGEVMYPDDRDETGEDLLQYIVSRGLFDTLELLLTEWNNVLPRKGVSRRAGWAANRRLVVFGHELDERESELLQQVISHSETVNELVTSRVHQAAKQGHGMAEALAQDGWALDLADNTSRAPLHWAVINGHADAVQHLIDAGADVNIKDVEGWTPLHFSASKNDTDCARRLLDAGYRHGHEIIGQTPLHVAAECGAVDIVRLMLSRAGKEEAKRLAATPASTDERLPLHYLAHLLDRAATWVEEIAKLLLDAYPGAIEAKDKLGDTPATVAIVESNVPLLRYLVGAGASLTHINFYRQNLLHVAACNASVPIIDFLLQQSIAGHRLQIIDHRIEDIFGDSPWDGIVYCTHVSPWLHGSMRHAGRSIYAAFAKLYQHIRDSNLRHDISTVQGALDALQGGRVTVARDRLCDLAKHKADGHNDGAAAWYRSLAKKIDCGEIDGAVDWLEQDLEDLRDELQSDPQEQRSRRDHMASQSQWLEVPDASFWIEPAAAFELQDVHEGHADAEEQQDLISDHPGGTQSSSSSRSLNYDLISHIYSDRGHLLYDRETAPLDPREFLRQYERESDHDEAELDLEARSNADDGEEVSPGEQDSVSADANRLENDA